MKVRITNNRKSPYGVEKVGGGYVFIQPGTERTVDAANLRSIEAASDIETEIVNALKAPPASLARKVRDIQAPAESLTEMVNEDFSGFLDRSIPAIREDLAGESVASLRAIRRDEAKGKSRKGLLSAIDEEIASRK